jgi:hypothetical protein
MEKIYNLIKGISALFDRKRKAEGRMDQREIVLAGLAPAEGALHSPVQVQKLFFLLDANIPNDIKGPLFNFQPYNYGPFDKRVYEILEGLAKEGYVEIVRCNSWNNYRLTSKGQEEGGKLLNALDERPRNYIRVVSDFVRSLSFTQLVTAIYKAYPDMRQNSVFQD